MGFLIAVVGILFALAAIMIYGAAKALPQQILAVELGIVAAVLFAGGCVVDAVDKLRKAVGRALEHWAAAAKSDETT